MHYLPADLRENTQINVVIFPLRVYGALIYSDQPFKRIINVIYYFFTCNMALVNVLQIYGLLPKYWTSIDNIAISTATTMVYISCNFQTLRLFFSRNDLVDIITYMITDAKRLFVSKDDNVTKIYEDYKFISKCILFSLYIPSLVASSLIIIVSINTIFDNAELFETDHFLDTANMPFILLMYPYRSFTRNFFFAYIYPFVSIFVGIIFIPTWHVMWSIFLLYPVFVFKLIKLKLENLDNIPLSKLNEEIISLVKLHIQTKSFIRKLETFVSRLVFVDFILFSVLMCFLLFQIAENQSDESMNSMILVLYFLIVAFMQLLYHAIATEILYQGSTLSTSFYLSSWYKYPVNIQKHGLIMMTGFNRPVQMQAVYIDMNLRTFLSILRAAYGYFTMLRNMNRRF